MLLVLRAEHAPTSLFLAVRALIIAGGTIKNTIRKSRINLVRSKGARVLSLARPDLLNQSAGFTIRALKNFPKVILLPDANLVCGKPTA